MRINVSADLLQADHHSGQHRSKSEQATSLKVRASHIAENRLNSRGLRRASSPQLAPTTTRS
eukprot:CAMPEP_0119275490 /NCGR_PEP_ID=MMETSP1329-20130426/13831_1 /TAXON_ID=114041 /ORGANISM="Genus nov. species nov., Strain RCC1024" /LENGTH=61 /DNA_ID=CAMNT_0007275871 /DNA_START=686 /DNA_END=868 /DNA_ORIENTATION=+